jgi:hypothetical protein
VSADPSPRSLEIDEQDYQLWRHHPVSKVVLQYIDDYRMRLREEALARWESGALQLIDDREMRGRVLACSDIVDLQFESIRSFYEGEKTET